MDCALLLFQTRIEVCPYFTNQSRNIRFSSIAFEIVSIPLLNFMLWMKTPEAKQTCNLWKTFHHSFFNLSYLVTVHFALQWGVLKHLHYLQAQKTCITNEKKNPFWTQMLRLQYCHFLSHFQTSPLCPWIDLSLRLTVIVF